MSKPRRLFALLTIATFFEGFDTRLVSLVQPVIGREFGASKEELGLVVGLSSLGMVFAFFAIHLADRFGRRPIFLAALGAYSLLTLATAFAPNLALFTFFQVFARMAMVVELGLAYLILSEEMPPEARGRVNGLFGGFVALGASVPDGLLHPLEQLGIGWRGLFLIGAVPLLAFPYYVAHLSETRAFLERREVETRPSDRSSSADATARSQRNASRPFAEERERLRLLFSTPLRRRLLAITGLWILVNFWSGTALYSFTLYVFTERAWTSADLVWLPIGTIPCGLLGYSLAGLTMDRIGRRGATFLYLVAASAATLTCYQADARAPIFASYFALVGLGGVWAVVTTWTAELFPTTLRATASGFGNNLIGRLGLIAGPIAVGMLGGALGSTGRSVSLLAIVPLLGLPLVFALPETRAVPLDEGSADTRGASEAIS